MDETHYDNDKVWTKGDALMMKIVTGENTGVYKRNHNYD